MQKIITTSVDKSKLDNLFDKNLEETKAELKKLILIFILFRLNL